MVVLGFFCEEAHVAAIGIVILVTGLIGGCELAVFDELTKVFQRSQYFVSGDKASKPKKT